MPKPTFEQLPAAKRQRIIDIAITEFAEHPYAVASVSRIVAQAGIAKGSIYQYFEHKQDFYLFLLDYANRQRIKVWGRARVVENDPALLASLSDPTYRARPERAIVFELETWNGNCPQHIKPRFTQAEIAPVIEGLQARITVLERELESLRGNKR